ncbi:tripartite tricarboxylate transporter substrate-binding protein [Bosea thiooxidans]
MGRTLGQQVVVENVAGAGGTAGAKRLAAADPDGYTLLIHHLALAAAPSLYENLGYDTGRRPSRPSAWSTPGRWSWPARLRWRRPTARPSSPMPRRMPTS